jgi:hypothetical protein
MANKWGDKALAYEWGDQINMHTIGGTRSAAEVNASEDNATQANDGGVEVLGQQ